MPSYLEATAFSDLDGQPAGIVGVAVDITERAETERQVRSARDYLHTITNSMGEGLFTMDTEGRLIYLNRAGERLLGWRQEELAGRNVHEATHYRRPDGSDYPIADCPLMAACREGGSVRLEDEVFIRKDGTEMPVEIVAEPFETEDGVRGSVVVFGDITERRARERRVRGDMESLAWVGRVRDALAEDRFVLYAQPIVEVATGTTVQHELLLRMLGDDGEVDRPGRVPRRGGGVRADRGGGPMGREGGDRARRPGSCRGAQPVRPLDVRAPPGGRLPQRARADRGGPLAARGGAHGDGAARGRACRGAVPPAHSGAGMRAWRWTTSGRATAASAT